MVFARRVTLVGTYGSSIGQACPRLPPRHSFEPLLGAASFRRIEYRSFSPTPLATFARFGTVSLQTHWQGLAPLSSLSFSWSAFLFGKTPEVVTLRLVRVATAKLPTPAALPEPSRALHPIGHVWLWSLSHWRDLKSSLNLRTRFEPDGSAALRGRAFPARPYSRGSPRCYEIESGDYSLLVAKDYFQKPFSNWTTHSRGNPALRDTGLTVGKFRPLSLMVSQVWRVPVPVR